MYFDTGSRIRELRKKRNISQDQLAEMSSLNRVTIAKYESGKIEPGAQALSRIADALEVSADEILGRGEPSPAETDELWDWLFSHRRPARRPRSILRSPATPATWSFSRIRPVPAP